MEVNNLNNERLSTFRNQIDVIDQELMRILMSRMALSKEIAAYKQDHNLKIRDRERELQLIEDRTRDIDDEVLREALTDVLEAILKASRDVQESMQEK